MSRAEANSAETRELRPSTAQERQAANTLRAAKEVAGELEACKGRLKAAEPSPQRRRAVKAELFDTSERLCNIMALALYQLTATLSDEFQSKLSEGFHELRQRLVQMGTELLLEKIEKIHARAHLVLGGEPYPIGLAARLRGTYVELTTHVKTLGGFSRLSPAERQLIDNTAAMIDRLAEIEESVGMILDFDGAAPRPARLDPA